MHDVVAFYSLKFDWRVILRKEETVEHNYLKSMENPRKKCHAKCYRAFNKVKTYQL